MDPETSADKTKSVKTRMSAYALRLPASIKAEAEKIAREDAEKIEHGLHNRSLLKLQELVGYLEANPEIVQKLNTG